MKPLVETKVSFLRLHVLPRELKDGSAVVFLKHIARRASLEVGEKESFGYYVLFFSFTIGLHARVHPITYSINYIIKKLQHVGRD